MEIMRKIAVKFLPFIACISLAASLTPKPITTEQSKNNPQYNMVKNSSGRITVTRELHPDNEIINFFFPNDADNLSASTVSINFESIDGKKQSLIRFVEFSGFVILGSIYDPVANFIYIAISKGGVVYIRKCEVGGSLSPHITIPGSWHLISQAKKLLPGDVEAEFETVGPGGVILALTDLRVDTNQPTRFLISNDLEVTKM